MVTSATPEGPDASSAEDENPVDGEDAAPAEVEPVIDADTGEELGEVSGGGGITDLGGDSPSS